MPNKEWLFDDSWENGIRIDNAKQTNTRVAGRMNVIQISTTDHMILYDLESEQELDNLLFYSELASTN